MGRESEERGKGPRCCLCAAEREETGRVVERGRETHQGTDGQTPGQQEEERPRSPWWGAVLDLLLVTRRDKIKVYLY